MSYTESLQDDVNAVRLATPYRLRDPFRRAKNGAMPELVRTSFAVVTLTVFVCLAIFAALLGGASVYRSIQWAWVPPRSWHFYQAGCLFLAGAAIRRVGMWISRLLAGNELSLIVSFVFCSGVIYRFTVSRISDQGQLWGFEPPAVGKHVLITWGLATAAYTLGCWRARQIREEEVKSGTSRRLALKIPPL